MRFKPNGRLTESIQDEIGGMFYLVAKMVLRVQFMGDSFLCYKLLKYDKASLLLEML